MLRIFHPIVSEPDPLQVEIFTSGLIGSWWNEFPADENPDENPDEMLGGSLIDYASRRATTTDLAFLRAMEVMAVGERQRDSAAAGAATLAARGVAEPVWASTIGRVRVGECWQLSDVYGDQASLFCAFDRDFDRDDVGDGAGHALMTLVDFNQLAGSVIDVFVTDEPAATLDDMRTDTHRSDGIILLRQVSPKDARRLIERAFAATDMTLDPDVSADFREYRALALARCRVLPEPGEPSAGPAEITSAERDALVESFLAEASPGFADQLPDQAAVRYCTRLIVDFGCDYDRGQPLRVGPARTEVFLLHWLPGKAMLDADDREAMPTVLRAWVRWAAARNRLPEAAVTELVEVTEECIEEWQEIADEDDEYDGNGKILTPSPVHMLLRGVGEIGGLEEAQDILDRRIFAMPYFGTRIGDEDYPNLDPGDPDERRLLIIGEHPEFHRALDDPEFDADTGGVNPRLHIAVDEIVVHQLWENDPAEVWQAAQRLTLAGMDRLDVLHMLGEMVLEHLHGAAGGGRPIDTEAYRTALNALAPR
ncbi:DUF1841 family protein [Frankia sp. Cppng1_Ct_nod]|uniref:DUF1841 family protein n=1 Tax=Frankia sp. Cppng1_Ct_nod TaxID=2897162 RepID=UPI0013EF9C24|nr:DUF1841 family protein [Frankia sp. Cppng1_Ct_nod]